MDQTLEYPNRVGAASGGENRREGLYSGLVVVLLAALIYVGCVVSPPGLMDDVDAVQAQIARNILTSGDWVIARLDGVPYLEKSPLIYWLIAISYRIFGVHDWAARLGVGLLRKAFIAGVAPPGGIVLYLVRTRQLFARAVWKRVHVFTGVLI